jgi:hypothetical protein
LNVAVVKVAGLRFCPPAELEEMAESGSEGGVTIYARTMPGAVRQYLTASHVDTVPRSSGPATAAIIRFDRAPLRSVVWTMKFASWPRERIPANNLAFFREGD